MKSSHRSVYLRICSNSFQSMTVQCLINPRKLFLRERRVDHLGSYIQPFYVFVVNAIPLDRESYTKWNHVVFQLQKFQSSKNG